MTSTTTNNNVGVLKHHSLALICTDLSKSIEFYSKLGFTLLKEEKESSDSTTNKAIMENGCGLQLHLFKTSNSSPQDSETGKPYNVLMDDPNNNKYPGHTHFCLGVGSVAQARKYLKDVAKLEESGKREMLGFLVSVFIRDPDRIVVELERNDRKDDGKEITFDTLSKPPRQGIDHVGTRVTNIPTNSIWYEQYLGLTEEVLKSEIDMENPLKNFRPWILRTSVTTVEKAAPSSKEEEEASEDSQADDPTTAAPPPHLKKYFKLPIELSVDINLIPNGTTKGEEPKNVLIADGTKEPLPGILYVCYTVKSINESIKGLDDANVAHSVDDLNTKFGIVNPTKFVIINNDNNKIKKSCFIRDNDHNIFRLVEEL